MAYVKEEEEEEEDGIKIEQNLYEDDADPDLDISKLKDSVWLVKVPKFIYEQWSGLDDADDALHLGKVQIENNNFNNLRLVLEENEANRDLPTEYQINMVNKQPIGTFVFSEEAMDLAGPSLPPTNKMAMAGTVAHECSLTPKLTDKYRALLQQRQMKAEMPVRQVQRLDGVQHTTNTTYRQAHSQFANFTQQRNKKLVVSSTGPSTMPDRGVRMDKSDLLDDLFRRFEEFEYWTIKGLREVTRQPEAWLREVLNEVGVLIKKGPYALKWTLKPEYKNMKGKAPVV